VCILSLVVYVCVLFATVNVCEIVNLVLSVVVGNGRKMKSRVIDSFSLFGEREDITYHIFSENQQDDNVGIESSMNIEEFVRIRALKVVSGDDNKLFVNHIWEGSIVLTDFIVKNFAMFIDNSVLELGAGTSLPSIVVSKFSPSVVVASDFPDENLLNHIKLLSQKINVRVFLLSLINGATVSTTSYHICLLWLRMKRFVLCLTLYF
jgi:hypothetical protein